MAGLMGSSPLLQEARAFTKMPAGWQRNACQSSTMHHPAAPAEHAVFDLATAPKLHPVPSLHVGMHEHSNPHALEAHPPKPEP